VVDEDPLLWRMNGLDDKDKDAIHKCFNVVQRDNIGMSNVWYLCQGVRMRSFHTRSVASGSGTIFPCLNISLLATRRPEFYLWNIEVPMFVLTSLIGLTWAIAPEEVGDRISVSLTLVLTAVAYKLTVAQSIPQVAYLTLLDKYVSLCFIFMVVATVENALLPSLVQHGADRALTDIVCLRIWGSGWLACCAWYVVTAMRLQNKRWRAMQDYDLQNSLSHGEGLGTGTMSESQMQSQGYMRLFEA
jgi:hypothetical protein